MAKLTNTERAVLLAALRTGKLRRVPGGYVGNGEYEQTFHARTVMSLARAGWLAEDVFDYVPTAACKTQLSTEQAAA